MSDHSAIEWCDATWNPVRGCVKVSPGCAHCYAEVFAERFRGVKDHPYEQGFDLRLVPEKLGEPQHWNKPRRVFVNSMSDLFQDGVPDDYIAEVWKTMATIRRHVYQVLTKRADRMQAILPRLVATFGVLPNVWLGTSVENQHFADERIPLLLQTPAAVRFISAEPLLGPVDLARWLLPARCISTGVPMRRLPEQDLPALDWVIVGGESGPGARPCRTEWIADIVKTCRAARTPVFVKQMGSKPYVRASRLRHWEWRHIHRPEDKRFTEAPDDALGWRVHLSSTKGGDISEWPEDLRVRQFPEVSR